MEPEVQDEDISLDRRNDSISKQVILENDEFYENGAANADLMHLDHDPNMQPSSTLNSDDQHHLQKRQTADAALTSNGIADQLVAERSKESTDMQAPSQVQLEYSRSVNAIDPEETPFVNEVASHHDAERLSAGRPHKEENNSYVTKGLLEKTP